MRTLFLAAVLVAQVAAKIHKVSVSDDSRTTFSIETFGFVTGGVLNITVDDFKIDAEADQYRQAILVRLTTSETEALESVEVERDDTTCMIDETDLNFFTIEFDSKSVPYSNLFHVVNEDEQGLYHILYTRCAPAQGKVSFELSALLYNPGPDYLSAGESPVPTILFVFSGLFLLALIMWVKHIRTHPTKVHHVHHMMSVLVLVKIITLLAEGLDKHYVKVFGEPLGWNVVYYIFTFIRGVMFFTVVLLIGTGWSLLKPTLNSREKKIVLVVLSLQVIDNIALIVEEEITTGSSSWLQWRDVLHLVDIICCAAVLFPIVWQIRHLREAAAVDGKVERNLAKLTQFRQFYVSVVTYVYFTRIIVFLLGATLPFYMVWLRTFFRESATLAFFTFVAYKFRPEADNPYLRVSMEDDDDENLSDFGLQDGDVELVAPGAAVDTRIAA